MTGGGGAPGAAEARERELEELLAEVRRIDVQSRRLVAGAMAGGYLSVFRGSGIEIDNYSAQGGEKSTTKAESMISNKSISQQQGGQSTMNRKLILIVVLFLIALLAITPVFAASGGATTTTNFDDGDPDRLARQQEHRPGPIEGRSPFDLYPHQAAPGQEDRFRHQYC